MPEPAGVWCLGEVCEEDSLTAECPLDTADAVSYVDAPRTGA